MKAKDGRELGLRMIIIEKKHKRDTAVRQSYCDDVSSLVNRPRVLSALE
jgi:hypothetical protein